MKDTGPWKATPRQPRTTNGRKRLKHRRPVYGRVEEELPQRRQRRKLRRGRLQPARTRRRTRQQKPQRRGPALHPRRVGHLPRRREDRRVRHLAIAHATKNTKSPWPDESRG